MSTSSRSQSPSELSRVRPRAEERRRSPCTSFVHGNSSRAAGATVGQVARTRSRFSTSQGLKLNLCFFCWQGGLVRTCQGCESFSACISQQAGIIGCLPSKVLKAETFLCPKCCKQSKVALPYPIPSRSYASSHTGMDTSPTIFISVFLQETPHFLASVNLLEAQIQGYYHAKESEILILPLGFKDLGEKSEQQMARKYQNQTRRFKESYPTCRLIFLVQTHSDPCTGDLIYGPGKATSLNEIISHVLGSILPRDFTKSILLLNTCSGFLTHNPSGLIDAGTNFGFSAAFTPQGPAIDPLLVSKTFLYTVLDYYLLGCEDIEKVLKRCAQVDLLSHASVLAWERGALLHLKGAALCFRPNGVEIRCGLCNQPADYYRWVDDLNVVVFRCRVETDEHTIANVPRKWAISLLTTGDNLEVVEASLGRCRSILTRVAV